jgi:WS/DGAT/MGAT family acyltransferase
MQKLSAMDAAFLYLETPETPMHIAGLSICEPPDGEHNPYEAFKSQIAARLHEVPSFHRILMPTPFNIDHPSWVNADTVDFDYHVRHAALPKPGTVDQLRSLIERLHSQPLDRERPLWQFHVIEGLKTGHFALYTKMHHACLDGGGGIMAMDILSDREPVPRPPLPRAQIPIQTQRPGFFEVLGSAYGSFLQQQVRILQSMPTMARALADTVKLTLEGQGFELKNLKPAPKTPFNVRIGAQRAYGYTAIDIKEAKSVGKHLDATINDLVLACCGGALRRYLAAKQQLPKDSLVAGVPVSLREMGDTSNSNQVTGVATDIGSNIEDPLERLRHVQTSMGREKQKLGALKDVMPRDLSFFGAPLLATALAGAFGKSEVANALPAYVNVAISNVPAARRHLYFAGAKVVGYFPVSIPYHGCALNITLHGYVDRLDFGLTACRKAVPDVQQIADLILDEFKALRNAALPRETDATATPAAKPKKPARNAAVAKAAASASA